MAARQLASLVFVASLFMAPATAHAQEFKEWASTEDLFSANFPGEPVRTDIIWETEYGAKIPARVYRATLPGPRTYSVTVVNYNPVQAILTEKAKNCADQTDELCTGHTSFPGSGYWRNDVRGAMIYVAAKVLRRDVTMTHYAWSFLGTQAVENNELQVVNNKDKSRTFVNIFMHHNMLYIMEETTPANYPPPGLFVQSMSLKESDGSGARHYGVYFNGAVIDPTEARTCSYDPSVLIPLGGPNPGPGNAPAGGRGGGNGPTPGAGFSFPRCDTLPDAVRFQQGPVPVPGAIPLPAEQRR